MMRRWTGGLRRLALAAALLASACASDLLVEPTTPTAPTTQVTDTFAGSLFVNGAATFQFLSNRGDVTATLTSVAPDATVGLGLSLGTWNGLSCATVLSNDQATQGSSIIGTVNATGSLCVRVYDVGKVVEPLTFEVTVVHF